MNSNETRFPRLLTKLYRPPPRSDRVTRSHLLARLDDGLRAGRPLTLVSAPAGFGKTTLVSEWIENAARPAAWLSLDEGDNDPAQFFGYLSTAFEWIDSSIGHHLRPLLQSPQLPPLPALMGVIINAIAASGNSLTLVLDDYHLITNPVIQEVLEFLVYHQPPSLHTVIVTREDPPLPLARLRARSQVTEIRERDLRFTEVEAAAFLGQTMNLTLPHDAVAALAARTEGWIAGLQLAALALHEHQGDAGNFIDDFTGDDRYIMDYLITEVLQRQPEDVRDFLRQTAILEQLTADLCDAVTGRNDSQLFLERLEAANLFVIPLDHRREWYRYYRLFAEFLRATLDPGEREEGHQRAMRWYETHAYPSQAIQHSLEYAVASGQWDDAERLISDIAQAVIARGGIITLANWLDRLPPERLRADSDLAIYKGWTSILTGQLALAELFAGVAGEMLDQPGADRGLHLLLRAYIALAKGDYPAVVELARASLIQLTGRHIHWQLVGLWALAEAQERSGSIAETIVTLHEAGRVARPHVDQIYAALIEASLASALNEHGRRREAVAVCERALSQYVDSQGRILPQAGLILGRLALLKVEANQLEAAYQDIQRCIALENQFGVRELLNWWYGVVAIILHAQGRTPEALKALAQAREYTTPDGLSDASWLNALEVNIRLGQGDLAFAQRWAEMAQLSPDAAPVYLRIDENLAYARLLLAQELFDDARCWLARLEDFTRQNQLHRRLLTVHILQAVTADHLNQRPVMMEHLAQALNMAAPEEYLRAFLDEGESVKNLLSKNRHLAPAFVDAILNHARGEANVARHSLVEPLSDRELEVLRLIAAGLSNGEIAERLVIAPATVKRHINHVYGKLGVDSRSQAIIKADELGLVNPE